MVLYGDNADENEEKDCEWDYVIHDSNEYFNELDTHLVNSEEVH